MKNIFRLAVFLAALTLLAILARYRSGTTEPVVHEEEKDAMPTSALEAMKPSGGFVKRRAIALVAEKPTEAVQWVSLSGGETDDSVSPQEIDSMLEGLEQRASELENP